ncbi:hypothetical protein KRX51_01260 [Corynebacterium sp. TAE3-ERU12]|uniref:hypothetical protein n=1 Tax=Corynebacterium sp. TAE3-ERU12 TaxID=2849491 RepID=UPI001C437E85|nr:hypothetical protein [Corynebacterium sp. TAE3-ERU12]MBV7294547.1 hypothetical protein [Corynebacterium sp. TAE3-ERU12]
MTTPNKATTHPPEQIVGARQAWLATCALQTVAAIVTSVLIFIDPGHLMDNVSQTPWMNDSIGALDSADLVMVAQTGAVFQFLFIAIVAGVFAWLTTMVNRGANWARIVLIGASFYLIFNTLMLLLGADTGTGGPVWLRYAESALTVASACAAAAGLVLASAKQSQQWCTGPLKPKDTPKTAAAQKDTAQKDSAQKDSEK